MAMEPSKGIKWIMIAGPYSSGGAREAQRQKNLEALNEAALAVFEIGLTPVIGVNCALPLIRSDSRPDAFDRIMMPLSLAMSERCDACLRITGTSQGADQEVERFRKNKKPVFFSLDEIKEFQKKKS
ncbi:MAG: hypothetical protein FWF24_01635 [Alphaproteobacteria bacterium]|nr:hypothetical protein [Alphaproteobacteria bacterium]